MFKDIIIDILYIKELASYTVVNFYPCCNWLSSWWWI